MAMPRSIRWRLPLSYAAIALLTALALAAVLLPALRSLYAQRERAYLRNNALAISAVVAQLLEAGAPLDDMREQLQAFAFLSRVRVQVLDAEQEVLVDSTLADGRTFLSFASTTVVVDAPSGEAAGTPVASQPAAESSVVVVRPADGSGSTSTVQAAVSSGSVAVAKGTEGDKSYTTIIPVVETLQGLGFSEGMADYGRRSDQRVREPVRSAAGDLLGYVELSDGPAYGSDAVASAAWGSALAGLVAVVIAAGAGWAASRSVSRPVLALSAATARMAEGDLAARADTARRDELGQLARSFNQMAGRVEATVTALRRFVADAAHELHTPLTALHTDLELAASEPDTAARAELIKRAQEQVERLEALTSGLLDLSRLEASAAQTAPATLDLAALARHAGERYASQAEQAGLTFSLELPAEEVVVCGDAAQLRRALGNLLDNACKFTPEGGTVSLRLHCAGGWAELAVEDSGIGIPAGDLPHLFSRFHRGSNTAGYPGNGLGLAIVRAIVEAHGGDVRAENTGHGARFTLRLKTKELRS